MATVGYGDLFPVTNSARFFVGIPAMIFGIGFLGFIISETASKLILTRSMKLQGLGEVSMKDHIIIINYTCLDEILYLLREIRADVKTRKKKICLVDETLEEIPRELAEEGVHYVKGNPADEPVLKRADLPTASHVIILSKDRNNPHSDDQNLVTTLMLEKMNPGVQSVVEVLNPAKIHQVEVAGADSAVCMSEFRYNLMINEIQDPGVKHILNELTSRSYGNQFYFIPIESMKSWEYRELALWGIDNGVSIIGIVRGEENIINCSGDFKIRDSDRAIVIGTKRLKSIKTA
jgi:voltage-gated potassium channel